MILLSDGFDSYFPGSLETGDSLDSGNPGFTDYGEFLTIGTASGRFGGQSLQRASGDGGHLPFSWGTGQRALAFWFKFSGGSAASPILSQPAGALLLANNGTTLIVKDGAGTTRITAAAALTSATYAWIELSYQTNYIELRVGNVVVGSYTGSYTDPGADVALGFETGSGTDSAWDIDDLIVWDNTSTFNTFGLAPRRIQLLNPDAAGDSAAWTPNGPTNWESQVGTGWLTGSGNAAGVQSVSSGQKDLYSLSNLTLNPASIDAVTFRTAAYNSGGTAATLAFSLKNSGGTEATSDYQPVDETDLKPLEAVYYLGPSGAAWTAAEVNGLQAGITSGV